MNQEEALNNIAKALSPESLTKLQIDIFQRAWNKQSYYKMAGELNHEYSYIKDVGAQLWKLLSQALGIQVTKLNLQDALMQYGQHQQMGNISAWSKCNRVDWGEAVDVSRFCGRQEQLDTLKQWVMHDRCRLIAIAGIGGMGKTMLVTQLARQLANTGQFEIIVWRSLWQAPSLFDFVTDLMSAIAPEQLLVRVDVAIRQLLKLLRYHRCLLILDNVEAVLASSELVGTYRPGYEDYEWLFQQLGEGHHQSTVLLTTREIPKEVTIPEGATAPVRLLRLKPLSVEAGKTILGNKGLIPAQEQVKELIERYQGNPRALEIVATPLKDLFNNNIAAFLAQNTLLFKDIRTLLTQQFDRLSFLEWQVMYWLAINQEAVTAAQLQADLQPSISLGKLGDALVSLDRRSLIEKIEPNLEQPVVLSLLDEIGYTQQPMVMEYVLEQLTHRVCQEVKQGQIDCLRSYVLIKAQAKDYVQDNQRRLIVQPILTRLLEEQGGSSKNLEERLLQLLHFQRSPARLFGGYFTENAIALLRQLGTDLSHLNLKSLTTWQTYLPIVNLCKMKFSRAGLNAFVCTPANGDI